MIFHTIIVSMVVLRSPTNFAVSCVIFAMMCRIVMVFGFYCNEKAIYLFASGMEIFINFMLLFICMAYTQFWIIFSFKKQFISDIQKKLNKLC